MSVVYSTGARVGGGGIGRTALHAAIGLQNHDLLTQLLCGSFTSTGVPDRKIRSLGLLQRMLQKLAVYDGSKRIDWLEKIIYDQWASRNIKPAKVFHVWNGYGLRSLRQAKKLGMVTCTERASCHPLYQQEVLREEHLRWGIEYRYSSQNLDRSLSEIHLTDYVLVPSDFACSSFVEQGYPREKILQIPFSVDVQKFFPVGQKFSSPFRVLFAGNIGLRKGVIYLLEAWRQLGWKDAVLDLVGRVEPSFSPLLDNFRDLTGVILHGYVPNPVELYQQADIFALPSLEEGSALVTYEALACGIPQVTTANAGSVVREGEDGYIVPARDVDDLAGRLEALRTNDQLRCQMGAAARERAMDYTWEKYGQRLSQTLLGLI